MIEGRKVLGVIPARGGSKGVPGKNIRLVAGKPLIALSIEQARNSLYIDRTVVSSDDQQIISVARQWGGDVPFVRPAELATDEAPGMAPVLHALEQIPGYDYVVLLQPTSPLRLIADIDGCIQLCVSAGAPACVSVTPVTESPYWMFAVDAGSRLRSLLGLSSVGSRRQDLPQAYSINGAVYVARVDWLRKTGTFIAEETLGYVMPRERSIDLDTEQDLEAIEKHFLENPCKSAM
jgi:CMP-N,N'-diacetyllegionaminic acid synthase